MEKFRGRLFGGFNRKDVVRYIESLASERNALAEENERLREELGETQAKLERCKPNALDSADGILGDLENRYMLLCADVEVNAAHFKCETEENGRKLNNITEALRETGKRISDLRDGLHSEV